MKRVLMITICDFFDKKSGMKMNLNTHYQSIVELYGKENVYLAMLDQEIKRENNNFKVGHCKNKLSQFLCSIFGDLKGINKTIEKRILNIIKEIKPDIVLCDTSCFGSLCKKIKKYNPNIWVVSFFHDVDCDLEFNKLKKENILFVFSYFAALRQERLTIKYSNKLICLNKRDMTRIKEKYGKICDAILPVMIKDTHSLLPEIKGFFNEEYYLFVGALFGPNVDAMKWYSKEIAPFLKTKTYIVGKDFEKIKNEFECSNVVVIGTVENLSIYYQNAKAVVMPLRYGTGMKIKVAEALMFGKTIVGTNEAFEGYDIIDGREGYLANKTQDFIDCLNNNEFLKFNEFSRKLYLDKYFDGNAIKIFDKVMNRNESKNNL